MSKERLKGAIRRVEDWSAPYRRIGEHQRADDLGRIIAAARSTIEPEPCSCGRCLAFEARDYHSSKPIPTVEFNGHNQDAEPDSETIYIPLITGRLSGGRLGATVPERSSPDYALTAALDMAERRILRLEMALRRSGVEVELVELPE